ncbi:hypothetical protein M885DRAFT_538556, partial [Pelagophyceae sp. CCMP2097]
MPFVQPGGAAFGAGVSAMGGGAVMPPVGGGAATTAPRNRWSLSGAAPDLVQAKKAFVVTLVKAIKEQQASDYPDSRKVGAKISVAFACDSSKCAISAWRVRCVRPLLSMLLAHGQPPVDLWRRPGRPGPLLVADFFRAGRARLPRGTTTRASRQTCCSLCGPSRRTARPKRTCGDDARAGTSTSFRCL